MSPLDAPTSRCESCRAEIVWATTSNGNPMPVNAAPSPQSGNVTLSRERGRLVATVLGKQQAARMRATRALPLHLAHFVDCPNANQHRRRTR